MTPRETQLVTAAQAMVAVARDQFPHHPDPKKRAAFRLLEDACRPYYREGAGR